MGATAALLGAVCQQSLFKIVKADRVKLSIDLQPKSNRQNKWIEHQALACILRSVFQYNTRGKRRRLMPLEPGPCPAAAHAAGSFTFEGYPSNAAGITPVQWEMRMRIGLAGPADLTVLSPFFPNAQLPPGLGASIISQLVPEFLNAGDHVILYALDENVDRLLRFDCPGLTIHVGPYRRRHRMRDLMAVERRAVRDMIFSDPPDVISAYWCYEYALGAAATRLPMLVTACDWAPRVFQLQLDAYRLGRLAMFLWTLAVCRNFAAPSPHIADLIERVGRRKCTAVGQPIQSELLRSTPRLWPGGAPTLVSIANGWGRLKNTQTLIEAFSLLRHDIPDASLVLLGHDHGPGQPAERWAQARGIEAGINFAGPVPHPEILPILSSAHLYVHPSREESFGQTILEAQATGTPVVAGQASGGVPWVLDNGRAGILTDIQDPRTLADAIVKILKNPADWQSYSAAGLKNARTRFMASAIAARYRELLSSVISEKI